MTRKTILINLLISAFFFVNSPSSSAQPEYLSLNNAKTIEAGRLETGIFQPLRYGLSDQLEVAVHPLLFALIPNVSVKRLWWQTDKLFFASQHIVTFPSPLLKTLARKGSGGILPEESIVKPIVALNTKLLFTWLYNEKNMVTFEAGVKLAASNKNLDLPTIDLPLVFPRTAAYYERYALSFAVVTEGSLYKQWEYIANARAFVLPYDVGKWALEQSTKVRWVKPSGKMAIEGGYILTYGDYPFGKQLNILPVVDLRFAFGQSGQ